MTNRIDVELLYDFPVGQSTDLKFRWRTFTHIDESDTEFYLEIEFVYFTDKDQTTGFWISYADSSLPPIYQQSDSIKLGLPTKLF